MWRFDRLESLMWPDPCEFIAYLYGIGYRGNARTDQEYAMEAL